MNIDKSNIKGGTPNQVFVQGQEVMVRRLGDGMEYKAKIAGLAVGLPEFSVYILEIVDPLPDNTHDWSHFTLTAACIDPK